jgi:hypothetical protein
MLKRGIFSTAILFRSEAAKHSDAYWKLPSNKFLSLHKAWLTASHPSVAIVHHFDGGLNHVARSKIH